MNLQATRVGDSDVVEVTGEVDLHTVEDLEAFISDLEAPKLVIDLTRVTFMDTTGIRFLLDLSNRLTGEDRKLALVLKEQSPVYLLLKVTGLSDQFAITESEDIGEGEPS